MLHKIFVAKLIDPYRIGCQQHDNILQVTP